MLPQVTLGIDVSKASIDCSLRAADSDRILWHGVLPRTSAGLSKLVKRVPPEAAWVVEPTGRYSHTVAAAGVAAGREVLLARPRAAQAFLRSLQDRAKTDQLDSAGLAAFGLAVPLRAYPLKDAVVERAEQLQKARRGLTDSRVALEQQAAEMPEARAVLAPAIAALREQVRLVDRELAKLVASEPSLAAVRALQQVPGIGPVTAVAVGACLEAKQFERADAFVAYIGLDVKVRQSGQRSGQSGLSKQGDAELRRLLYLCAKSTLRIKDSPFRAQYERELEKGLAPTAALNAMARKMARLCWSMHRYRTSWDPDRVNQPQPARPAGV